MKTVPFKKIDAFTDGTSPGNPAGYVLLDDTVMTVQEMQRLARELKGYVNEVGYVKRSKDAFSLRFYSSECEVAFCGHATIAIMYDLLKNNRELTEQKEVFIDVSAGRLSVFNHIAEEDAVYIMAPEPVYHEHSLTVDTIADALQTSVSDLDTSRPVKLIDGGLKTLLVPIKTLPVCTAILPDQEQLRLFCLANEIDIIHLSTGETSAAGSSYRTRVFAPKYGYLEDPATGSGNAAFGYYLISQKLWNGDITVEQGPDINNPNLIKLKKSTSNGKTNILFGGKGTTRVSGDYFLHSSNKTDALAG